MQSSSVEQQGTPLLHAEPVPAPVRTAVVGGSGGGGDRGIGVQEKGGKYVS